MRARMLGGGGPGEKDPRLPDYVTFCPFFRRVDKKLSLSSQINWTISLERSVLLHMTSYGSIRYSGFANHLNDFSNLK